MMSERTRVKVRKIGQLPDAQVAAGDWESYVPGVENPNVSLPVEYEIEGYMVDPPALGASFVVERTSRNGIKAYGEFSTSPITVIAPGMIKTQNSIYTIEKLEP